MSWKTIPMIGMPYRSDDRSISGRRLAAVGRGERLRLILAAGLGALEAEDALDDRADDEEEQDRRLEDADEVGRDAGLDLHRRGAACASRRTAAPRATMPIGLVRPSSATAMASKPTVVPYVAVICLRRPRAGRSRRPCRRACRTRSSSRMIRWRGDMPA